jgi:hypothetical protein
MIICNLIIYFNLIQLSRRLMPESIQRLYQRHTICCVPWWQRSSSFMICWLAAGLVNSMDDDEDSHNLAQAAEMVFDRGAGLLI